MNFYMYTRLRSKVLPPVAFKSPRGLIGRCFDARFNREGFLRRAATFRQVLLRFHGENLGIRYRVDFHSQFFTIFHDRYLFDSFFDDDSTMECECLKGENVAGRKTKRFF